MVQDSLACDAQVLRLFVHVYVFIYVVLLSWTIPMMVIWVASGLLSSSSVQLAVLRQAKKFDQDFSIGVPIVTLLAKTFLFRRMSQTSEVEQSDLRSSLDELRERKAELEKRSTELGGELQAKQDRLQAMMQAREAARAELTDPASEAARQQAFEESMQKAQETAAAMAQAAVERAQEAGADMPRLLEQAKEVAASGAAEAGAALQRACQEEITKGSLVRVLEDFESDSHPRTMLSEGWEGTVVEIQSNNVAIQFDRLQSSVAWIRKQDLSRLKVVKVDQSPSAKDKVST